MNLPDDLKDYHPTKGESTMDTVVFWIVVLCLLAAVLMSTGCATELSVREHEEKHCDGYTHNEPREGEIVFVYEWTKTRAASEKPWFYVAVEDTNVTCRFLGPSLSLNQRRINGCAIWKPQGCEIYLPK